MLTLTDINRVLANDPEVEPSVFWARVGVDLNGVGGYARMISDADGIPWNSVMALLETGATIAEAGMLASTGLTS